MMMQLEQIFSDALGIELEQVSDALSYQGIPQWDSVAHMGLIAQLEDHYGVLLDTDDIIDMSSVAKAREILAKYGVAL
ncbi:acyl carrier protein [Aeromonas enteropelogenes]|uniref:Acyl carrier protein n=2 Tax=Aeromonas TaxID=642 RepID=A0ABU9J8Y1_AEREN|nr:MULTISPECIES: acyl carrier protein [Aeromonas]QXC32554.1 acyl carrier protein [Aeromonas sp. FDAARGOS 1407]AUV18329.1 acyl carrier protein [Aeromonas sp. ASNIH7]MBL0456184.1 acyl carrier protein [Aeromonas enteropelogenes]MBL0519930.1 acyl carrier protein [Aeromonas enteropelogenes]MDX7918836.1 acyl carrier protein [Aeromonas caviae]